MKRVYIIAETNTEIYGEASGAGETSYTVLVVSAKTFCNMQHGGF